MFVSRSFSFFTCVIGEEADFRFDMREMMRKGHDFKDYICPDTFEFAKDFFRMSDYFGRVIFLRDYASYIKDSMIAELCDLNRNLLLSLDMIPIPTDEAVREVENRLLGVGDEHYELAAAAKPEQQLFGCRPLRHGAAAQREQGIS